MQYFYDCFSSTLEFAESLGFEDDETQCTPELMDALEEEAIRFIESKGYEVVLP